ncbi:protocadherin Fat 1-like [Petromyzon marinus]|uniref:protocadherin Fat 1-like n=1 Tax=Petromyzon marinus TaxID=7757 RepID=UPI003F706A1A
MTPNKMASALLPLLLLLLPPCGGQPEPPLARYFYNATVYENSAPRTYVESHSRMGFYIGLWGFIPTYSIVSGDEGAGFTAEGLHLGDTLILRIRTGNVPLNREERPGYVLGIRAVTWSRRCLAFITVYVRVMDRNEFSPLFSMSSYGASDFNAPASTVGLFVTDDAPAGTVVVRVAATDADEGPNGRIRYAMADRVFAVHPTSGAVMLVKRLKPDDWGMYILKVLAVDSGGLSSSARITVNVVWANQDPPRIAVVATHGPRASFADPAASYAELAVEDNDGGPAGEISAVEIIAGDPLRAFSVAPTDGTDPGSTYAVRLSGRLDWADFPFGVNLTVQARDGGRSPKHSRPVRVTVREGGATGAAGAFERSVYAGAVERRSPPRAVVLAVRASCGARSCRYVVRGGADGYFFAVNPATGVVSVRKSLAAVDRRRLAFNVGTDVGSGVASVTIDVVDYNEHAPVFERPNYFASLSEDVPTGTFVLVVHATDKDEGYDGRVTYGLADAEPGPFTVDPFTGIIVTTGPLDHDETAGVYWLHVRASDWGTPFRREAEVIAPVRVANVNDNAPVFVRNCVGEIPRDLRPGEPIFTVLAIDADDLRPVLYGIASGNEGGFFALDDALGVVTLARSLADVAVGPAGAFHLGLTATDGELSAETFLNISVLDARPGWRPSLQCVATEIAQRMGEMLHRADQRRDRPRPVAASTVNRHAPAFAAPAAAVEVREDLRVGAEVIRMEAEDPDDGFEGKLLYALTDGGASGFAVDAETGVVRVLVPLDYETVTSYSVNVVVHDLGTPRRSASATVRVVILDVNDNRPEFSRRAYAVRVPERVRPGHEVLRLEAADGDEGDAGSVRYRLLSDTDLFRVDAETGALEVAAPLDRERRAEHTLLVEASDLVPEESRLSSVAAVIVTVDDVDDHTPTCAPDPLRLRVPEDVPVGAVLGWLDARDPDVGPAGEVHYTLVSVDEGDGTFTVHETSGALQLARPLDFERRRRYDLTVATHDGDPRGPPSTVCRVTVEVTDVDENNHAPRFAYSMDSKRVPEDIPVGTAIFTATATDHDEGLDGEVRYSLVGGSDLGVFSIHLETGVIVTMRPLDRETVRSYWLEVRATDRGVFQRFSTLHIYVDVQDVNDNPPWVSQTWNQADAMENSHSVIFQVKAWDPDKDSVPRGKGLTFNIVSGDPQGMFTVNKTSGVISNTPDKSLDRETQAEYELEVSIVDTGVPPLETRVVVSVNVLDRNDHTPRFPRDLQHVYVVLADDETEVEIARFYATDADSGDNARIAYDISPQVKYRMDGYQGIGILFTRRNLHRAGTSDTMELTAMNTDLDARKVSTKLRVDWVATPLPPETPPAFAQRYHAVTVAETAAVGSVVIALPTQSTAGSLLWFSITGGNVEDRFYVTQHGGVVELAQPLDAEQRASYELTIRLTDGSNAVTTLVEVTVLDVNDNRPRFSHGFYNATVAEDSPGAVVSLRLEATDADAGDAGRLFFSLVSLGGNNAAESMRLFRINPVTGEVTAAEELDREAKQSHVLTVMVQDARIPVRRAYTTVLVSVIDDNDHTPVFTVDPYEAYVAEWAAVGSTVIRVNAFDRDDGPNGNVRYSIKSGNVGNSFAVHHTLGVVSVARKLNGSAVESYELMVRAEDHGRPQRSTVATVRIVVNAYGVPPKFAPVGVDGSAEVTEGAVPGSFVLAVSASGRSTVTYEIREGDPEGAFDIHPTSGVVATKRPLDRERTLSYRLTVRATDAASLSADASVSIRVLDENDNAPVFDRPRYRGAVGEEAVAGTPVLDPDGVPLVIRAADADDGEGRATVAYRIVEREARKYFSVDPRTGAVRMAGALDRETTAEFRFRVTASDGGSPKMSAKTPAEVTVAVLDANDCPPAFSTAAYETTLIVPTRAGVRLLTLAASDPDVGAVLTYRVASGNVGDAFAVDTRTGDVAVRNASLLAAGYYLRVEVSDGRFSSAARVKVSVRAVGGRLRVPPKYSARIPENSTAIAAVAVVVATGGDLNEPLVFGLLDPSGTFRMRPTAGILETAGVAFDREERDRYELLVEVRGGPSVARTLVEVDVEDVNDNAPAFVGLPYRAVVRAAAAPGSAVLTVAALDRDVGENARVRYSLRDDHDGRFVVDHSGGNVSLRRSFAPDASGEDFVVTVVATDCGVPPLSSAVDAMVTVLDEDAPAFESLSHVAWVPEDVVPPAPIAHVHATAPGGPPLVFSIVDGDPFEQFSVDFGTGVVSVVGPLDRETRANYRLAVRAASPATGLYADTSLDVVVGDVNDNRPLFARGAYAATLSEFAPPGTSVVQARAADADSGSNRALRYEIVDDGEKGGEGFHVDPDGGLVVTTAPLDHERSRLHRFSVRATDGGSPPLAAYVPVTVTVEDENDNAPVFERPLYEASVNRLVLAGHFVAAPRAFDADASDAHRLRYAIVSPSRDDIRESYRDIETSFAIDVETGVVSVIGDSLRLGLGKTYLRWQLPALYRFRVSVTDGTFVSVATVAVDLLPAFEWPKYAMEIPENSEAGTPVVLRRAMDADASGRILGRAPPAEVIFATGYANDRPPRFLDSVVYVRVPEDAEPGLALAVIRADDADATSEHLRLTYHLTGGDPLGHFSLGPVNMGGEWTLRLERPLDREEKEYHILQVTATDCTYARTVVVVVIVLDVNDNDPVCDKLWYNVTVLEDVAPGFFMLSVSARDSDLGPNGTVRYSLHDAGATPFRLHLVSGKLFTRAPLDHEAAPVHALTVVANDRGGRSCRAEVLVRVEDMDDSAPRFLAGSPPRAVALRWRHAGVGTAVTSARAVDSELGRRRRVTHFLLDSAGYRFAIDVRSGLIVVKRPLERRALYNLTVLARAGGGGSAPSATAAISVSLRDDDDVATPAFRRPAYRVTVPEDAAPGTTVVTVAATFGGAGAPSYGIASGNELGAFGIDRRLGVISVVARALDYDKRRHHYLTVWAAAASDGDGDDAGGAATSPSAVTVVTVDVTDEPRFAAKSAVVGEEDALPGDAIVTSGAAGDASSEEEE